MKSSWKLIFNSISPISLWIWRKNWSTKVQTQVQFYGFYPWENTPEHQSWWFQKVLILLWAPYVYLGIYLKMSIIIKMLSLKRFPSASIILHSTSAWQWCSSAIFKTSVNVCVPSEIAHTGSHAMLHAYVTLRRKRNSITIPF